MYYSKEEPGAELFDDIEGMHQIANIGLWSWTVGTQTFSWSKQLFEIMGQDASSYQPTLNSAIANIHPHDRGPTIAQLLASVSDAEVCECEFRVVRSDGTIRICWIKVRPVKADGFVVRLSGVCFDITYLRKTEAAARTSETDYQNIIDLSPQMPWIADPDGNLLSVSSRFTEKTGLPTELALGQGWVNVIHADDTGAAAEMLAQAQAGANTLDQRYRVRCADGHYRWMRSRAYPRWDEAGNVVRWYGLSEDINAQVESEQRLRESEEHYRYTVALSPQIPWTADPAGNILELAPQWLKLFIGDCSENTNARWLKSLHPNDVQATLAIWSASLKTGKSFDCRYRLTIGTCDYRWFRARARPRLDNAGQIIRWYGVIEDIHEQVEAEEALRKSQERYNLVTQATNDLIWDHDLRSHTIEWNKVLEERFGYRSTELGSSEDWWIDRVHTDDRSRVLEALGQVIDGNGTQFASEYRFRRPDGTYAFVFDRGYILRTSEGEPIRAVGAMQDLSERKEAEARVLWTASHDELTGLPNRSLFGVELEKALACATWEEGKLALLTLDLDHFKQVNDTLGHDAGDELLRLFASRLKKSVHSSDTVARIGGDEFAVIIPGTENRQDLEQRASTILESMRQPFTYAGHILDCRASIGASIYPQHGNTPDELLKSADVALYCAKAAGRGDLMVFNAGMRLDMNKRSAMITRAREALRDDRVMPFYQPKIDYRTNTIAGFEALLRWRDPNHGLQFPKSIEAAFEDLELAAAISDRMIQLSIEDIRRWLDKGIDFGHVAVNASAAEFRCNKFAEGLLAKLERNSIPTDHFQLEVTETVFLGRGSEYVERALKLLSSEGVKIALDDFGTGFASLRHLKQFPVDIIKIDQSFVRGMATNSEDEAIVRAVINLGKSLDICVVAEGIETPAQDCNLRQLGCDFGQGFIYSKAVQSARVPRLMRRFSNGKLERTSVSFSSI